MPRTGPAPTQPEREEALLALADAGRTMRAEPRHVEALADLCDGDDERTLALLLLSRATITFPEGDC